MFEYRNVDNEDLEPKEDEEEEEEEEARFSRRQKQRYGPVRHLPGSFRPAKFPKGKVS